MAIIDSLLAELEQEAVTTARVLERVPQEHLDWRPHPKSMSLGQLALHIATVPGNVAALASQSEILYPPPFDQGAAVAVAELGPALAASLVHARLVYLRLLDVPVPSVYGPTADENPFAAA